MRPVEGTYWSEMGFFRVERGANAMQIENGDCWLTCIVKTMTCIENSFAISLEMTRGNA
ncbi:hypothetical protein GPECTOR_12g430 [Gonium pectorale]|uniref:Uncharacterized protein n=1 Tax=Gonium pectorale TaxID=33097 RepID=A0A150GNS4_GONPE|nr:hypothetical protein GPECTOR_12g430 [Gonium pectorale]|eukprot:KXZ51467.1 hypothetical protein GPECTOR_12g430 [Gonium pectorale]